MNCFKKGGMNPVVSKRQLQDAIIASNQKEQEPEAQLTQDQFFESLSEEQLLEAVQVIANANVRSMAASAVMQWVEGGDSSFDALDALCYGLAGGQDDEEMDDDEVALYQEILTTAANFCTEQGADVGNVQTMFEDDDDDAAQSVYDAVESATNGSSDASIIADFSAQDSLMTESTVKVIRNGKLCIINTSKRKRKMSSLQKMALAKARMKAHGSAAKSARQKSMRIRMSKGL